MNPIELLGLYLGALGLGLILLAFSIRFAAKRRAPIGIAVCLLGAATGAAPFVITFAITHDAQVSSRPASIATPQVIYQPNSREALPMPVVAWQNKQSQMILHSPGAWEWFGADPRVAVYDWRTDTVQELHIPDLRAVDSYSFAQSPTSNVIAYASHSETYLFDLSSAQTQKLADGAAPSFAPDGSRLALWRDGQLLAKNLVTAEEEVLYTLESAFSPTASKWQLACCTTWSPDGARIAFQVQKYERVNRSAQRTGEELLVLDLTTHATFMVDWLIQDETFSQASWSPDGRLLLYVKAHVLWSRGGIFIVDWRSGCPIGNMPLEDIDAVFWPPAGDIIGATNGGGRYLYFIDVEKAFGSTYTEMACTK